MKANELRIGNLLYYKNTVDVAMVEIIHKKHFDCRDKYGTFTPNGRYEPIPLTEEWLENFGFVDFYDEFNDIHSKIKNNFLFINGSMVGIVAGRLEISYLIFHDADHIRYVHQLQNLFFSLCGEELNVK